MQWLSDRYSLPVFCRTILPDSAQSYAVSHSQNTSQAAVFVVVIMTSIGYWQIMRYRLPSSKINVIPHFTITQPQQRMSLEIFWIDVQLNLKHGLNLTDWHTDKMKNKVQRIDHQRILRSKTPWIYGNAIVKIYLSCWFWNAWTIFSKIYPI